MNPCGYPLDALRSCYSTQCRFYDDSDIENRIVWYFTDLDAPPVPLYTRFGSGNWASDRLGWLGPGEVQGSPRPWRDGSRPSAAIRGAHPCGSLDAWSGSIKYGDSLTAAEWRACCGAPGGYMWGGSALPLVGLVYRSGHGLAWDGSALFGVGIVEQSSGGSIWNGAVNVSLALVSYVSGGLLWNGAATVYAGIVQQSSGGQFWGGFAVATIVQQATSSGGLDLGGDSSFFTSIVAFSIGGILLSGERVTPFSGGFTWNGQRGTPEFQQTFTSPGSWPAPAGITSVIVEAWGPGGGGKSGAPVTGGGGGGGGAFSKKSGITVTPGNSYSVILTPDSYFNTTATVLAKGGVTATGIPGGAGGAAGSGVGDTKFSGGNGAAGTATAGGGGGASAGPAANGGNASGATGGTAPTDGGNGGNGGGAGAGGSSGSAPGGGGGGGGPGFGPAGGAGGGGKVIVYW